ncbi:MAG: hypothetical protein P8J20_01835 [Novosphingobium sp.]|nr:hypothetical protein [Novosphingobium sp.]
MDLNKLFFKHQIALMRAAGAGKSVQRASLHVCADAIASRIVDIQRRNGAFAGALIPAAQL